MEEKELYQPGSIVFSNARKSAIIENWPMGFRRKVTASFTVERKPNGEERVTRALTDPVTGEAWEPKKTTYASLWAIADGSDGKTYLLACKHFSVTVHSGDLKYSLEYLSSEGTQAERFKSLFDMIAKAE